MPHRAGHGWGDRTPAHQLYKNIQTYKPSTSSGLFRPSSGWYSQKENTILVNHVVDVKLQSYIAVVSRCKCTILYNFNKFFNSKISHLRHDLPNLFFFGEHRPED
jgi:DNA polymerase II small subunit/DNA polymerase delta subunit B